ncbi:MAG: CotH kinase family protein [Saprospiraceae bacterium]|nr:CotH kinase family protein [Saprospiraceae bacterium]
MKKCVLSILGLVFSVAVIAQTLTQSNLPIVVINTFGVDIPNEPKIPASMGIIDNGQGQINHIGDPFNGYNGAIGIELRGSSSQGYEKKPYSIETRDANGEDLDVPLLGMPEESDWALIAPLNDKTLMRDVIMHAYARVALPWSPRTRYCEVIINGDYKGVYALIETIKRDPNRVAIKKLEEEDISGNALTGGYILRMDKYGESGGLGGNWVSPYLPITGSWQQTWFQYHYPKEEDIQPEQEDYIQDYITDFETMLASQSYADHYPDWIDVDSWVNYLLLQELGKNVDGYRLSAYFYKHRDDEGGKIGMGPIWDFNISLGIGDYCGGADYNGWAKDFNNICGGDAWVIHFWWGRLWNDPAFRHKVGERWAELRANQWNNAALFGEIDANVALLSQAQVRNFQRWPVFGQYVWPNAFIGNNYQEELTYLRTWLTNRLAWLDLNMALLVETDTIDNSNLQAEVNPNPAQEQLWVTLPRQANSPLTKIYDFVLYDASGREVLRQQDLTGAMPIPVDLGGRFPSGLYFWQLFGRNIPVVAGKVVIASAP